MFDLQKIIRQNIKDLPAYTPDREPPPPGAILLDLNENAFGSPLTKWYNRYPDPVQRELKKKIAAIKAVKEDQFLLTNGSEESIDVLIRTFCEPVLDNIIICPPVYDGYEMTAKINGVGAKQVALLPSFQLDMEGIEEAIDGATRIIFICSPNNPTGNVINREDVEVILTNFEGLVVVDEAYINYSRSRSILTELTEHPNLIVLQTFSKAWGLAGLRLGITIASPEVIQVLQKLKGPHNINSATLELGSKALDDLQAVNTMIKETVSGRDELIKSLQNVSCIQQVYPSQTNFILVRTTNAKEVYKHLKERKIFVKDFSTEPNCENCLRITVGTPEQNAVLIEALNEFKA